MKLKRGLLISFFILLCLIPFQARIVTSYDNYPPLSKSFNRISEVIELNYGEYVHVRQHVVKIIVFSFQCENPNVQVTGFLMEDNYFEQFQHGGGYVAFYLSDGPQNSAFGRYEVYQEDSWNIVFINDDLSGEPTIFHYWLLFDNEDPLIYITPVLAILLVTGVIFAIFRIRKNNISRDIQIN